MGAWQAAGVTLGEALNASGVWQTGGDAPWFAETNASGVVSIRSGDITAGQQSWVEVVIDGPALLTFNGSGETGMTFNRSCGLPGGFSFGDSWSVSAFSLSSASNFFRWTHYGAGITRLDKVVITPDLNTPYIVTAPTNQTLWLQNVDTSEAGFSVVAAGAGPLSYYWFKDKVLLNDTDRISGARTATLHIANISLMSGDAGTYSVLVSNVWGTALFGAYTSGGSSYHWGTGATLDVSGMIVLPLPMPLITEQPLSRIVTNGSTVEFNVTAISTNAPPFQYRWYFGASLILEGTSPVCRLIDVKPADLGNYWVAVNDGLNSSTSMVARLEFLPEFRSSPQRSPTSGQFLFQVSGHPGRTTDILASTNLIDWEVIGTVNNSADAQTFADPAAALLRRFYRLRQSAGSQ